MLAWQNQGFYNNTENEYVNFQYSDASGLSERSANKDGVVFGNYDAEGAAVERDPLGGNVGIFTPYFQLNSGPPPEPESPLLYPMNEFSQNSRNPNAITFYLDGIEVSYGVIASMARGGALAVEFWDYAGRRNQLGYAKNGIAPDSRVIGETERVLRKLGVRRAKLK